MAAAASIEPARAWLPTTALDDGTLERHLARVAEEWCARWLAKRGVGTRFEPMSPSSGGGSASGGEWSMLEDALAVSADEDLCMALAAVMLDLPASRAAGASGRDRGVLNAVAVAAHDDLCSRLAAAFGFPAGSPFRRGSRLPRALAEPDARTWALMVPSPAQPIRICASADLAVSLRKWQAARPAAPVAVRPLREGLARQGVSVAAHLGSVSLTLPDLAQLSAGDVVLIDRDPCGELELLVERRGKLGTCTLEESGGAYRLNIVQTLVSAPLSP